MSQKIIAANKRQVLCVPTTLSKQPIKVNKNQKVHAKKGHQIAHPWWADFNDNVEKASGYLVNSDLRKAFHSTPIDQRDAFLDSIGGYLVVWKTSGEPSETLLICAEEIRLQSMTPVEQDAHFDKAEASNE